MGDTPLEEDESQFVDAAYLETPLSAVPVEDDVAVPIMLFAHLNAPLSTTRGRNSNDDDSDEIVATTATISGGGGGCYLSPPIAPGRPRSPSMCVDDKAPSSSSAQPSHHHDVPAPFAASPLSSSATDYTWSPNYACMPRFGFPPSHFPYVASAESQFLRAQGATHLSACEQAWSPALRGVQMLAHAVPSEMLPLRRLCRKFGVPPHARAVVWLTLSGAATKAEENEGFCATLLSRFGSVTGDVADCIEKDLDRTFPDHPMFAVGGVGRARLKRVLHALCWRNPLLDYCQSFNFIAALLLIFLDDEEAVFWTMCYVLEVLLPNDYYGRHLVGLRTDQAVLADLLKLHVPKLAAHLAKVGFDAGVLVPAWVMSLFIGVLPVTAVVHVWDYFLTREPTLEPSGIPLSCCVAILKLHADTLMAMDDPGEMLVELTQRVQVTCDGLKVVKIAHELKVLESTVRALRRKHRSRLAQEAGDRAATVRRIESAARLTLQNQHPTPVQHHKTMSNASATQSPAAAAAAGSNGAAANRASRLSGSRARDSFGASPRQVVVVRPRAESTMRTVAFDPAAHLERQDGEDDDAAGGSGPEDVGEEMNEM
jgi:hypothetical protein